MKCCLCGEKIKVELSGWDKGNNAQPLKDGRCCNKCNFNKVLPVRLEVVQRQIKKKQNV